MFFCLFHICCCCCCCCKCKLHPNIAPVSVASSQSQSQTQSQSRSQSQLPSQSQSLSQRLFVLPPSRPPPQPLLLCALATVACLMSLYMAEGCFILFFFCSFFLFLSFSFSFSFSFLFIFLPRCAFSSTTCRRRRRRRRHRTRPGTLALAPYPTGQPYNNKPNQTQPNPTKPKLGVIGTRSFCLNFCRLSHCTLCGTSSSRSPLHTFCLCHCHCLLLCFSLCFLCPGYGFHSDIACPSCIKLSERSFGNA